jgi:hypothetical protein
MITQADARKSAARIRTARALAVTAPDRMRRVAAALPAALAAGDEFGVRTLLHKPKCTADWQALAVHLARDLAP